MVELQQALLHEQTLTQLLKDQLEEPLKLRKKQRHGNLKDLLVELLQGQADRQRGGALEVVEYGHLVECSLVLRHSDHLVVEAEKLHVLLVLEIELDMIRENHMYLLEQVCLTFHRLAAFCWDELVAVMICAMWLLNGCHRFLPLSNSLV